MTDYTKNSVAVFTNECFADESHECESAVPNIIDLNGMISAVTDLRTLPTIAFYILIVVLSLSLVFGSYFKSILYRVIYTEKFQERPINVMILVDAIVQHFSMTVVGMTLILSICFDYPSDIMFGEMYCHVTISIGVFGLFYLTVGSFATAIFRVCYIRYNPWTKYIAGERRILVIMMIAVFSLTLLLSVIYLHDPSHNRVFYNECIGKSGVAQSFLEEFNRRGGKHILPMKM